MQGCSVLLNNKQTVQPNMKNNNNNSKSDTVQGGVNSVQRSNLDGLRLMTMSGNKVMLWDRIFTSLGLFNCVFTMAFNYVIKVSMDGLFSSNNVSGHSNLWRKSKIIISIIIIIINNNNKKKYISCIFYTVTLLVF